MITILSKIYDEKFWKQCNDEKLEYALKKNIKYEKEIEKWLLFFQKKNWLNEEKIKDLRSGKSFSSFYGKINEFRAGYYIEKKKKITLTEHESPTRNNRNVEFKGKSILDKDIFIEVKTPIKLIKPKSGSFNNSDIVLKLLNKANKQLAKYGKRIVVLSDDLEVTLFYDLNALNSIKNKLSSYENIDEVWILGNIFWEDLYRLKVFKKTK